MVFYLNLRDSTFPQVARILVRILVILNNVVVWMVSIRVLISNSSSIMIIIIIIKNPAVETEFYVDNAAL